jgi:hypothetical protein
MTFPRLRLAHPAPHVRSVLACALALALTAVMAMVGPTAEAATTSTLALAPNHSAWSKIGPKRVSAIASVSVTVPDNPIQLGIQFRASAKSSGYRVKLNIAANGDTTGSFSRVKSYKQTTLASSGTLALAVKPGEKIHLEGTVVAANPVRLYLRAWKDGEAKPAGWNLVAKDSSSKRIKNAGSVYLWAQTPAGSPEVSLGYQTESVAAFSAARAAAEGAPATEPTSDSTFSVAVIGDTQGETTLTDPRFANRTSWLAAHKDALDIRYTLNTGDVTNWGWLTTSQYTVAKAALAKLSAAGMPYSVTVGNHDTEAVGWDGVAGSTKYGGSAYASNTECLTRFTAAQCKSWLLVRNTKEVNAAFPLSNLTNLGGVFEAGKIDNNWTSFTANNTKWMVLTLELWPRPAAVEWARNVVATHPDYNVIIETHHYLNGDATISTSNGGYGATSPKYLYDTIVSKYKNVKIVTSGHIGGYANRTDTPNGNTVLSYLGNDLGRTNNPVRILTINTTTGVVGSTIYNPIDNTTKGTTTGTISITR